MKNYVCGFLYNKNRTEVALIKKLRPAWQCGNLNGIGGHIEAHEIDSPVTAMEREFREETGVTIPANEWQHVISLTVSDKAVVHFFRAFNDNIHSVKTMTDEMVGIFDVNRIPMLNTVTNLRWLVPLVADVYMDFSIPMKMLDISDRG